MAKYSAGRIKFHRFNLIEKANQKNGRLPKINSQEQHSQSLFYIVLIDCRRKVHSSGESLNPRIIHAHRERPCFNRMTPFCLLLRRSTS